MGTPPLRARICGTVMRAFKLCDDMVTSASRGKCSTEDETKVVRPQHVIVGAHAQTAHYCAGFVQTFRTLADALHGTSSRLSERTYRALGFVFGTRDVDGHRNAHFGMQHDGDLVQADHLDGLIQGDLSAHDRKTAR